MKDKKQLNHAIPIDLYRWLKTEAEKERRSVSNLVVCILCSEKERRN